MAIRIVTGVPGAGKTYFAVDHIVKKYCISFGDTFALKKEYKIVTNIDGLLLDTVDLKAAIEKAGGLERFFSSDLQQKTTEKYQKLKQRLVYVIDEAQQFFHRRFYDREVFSFFENHRHYGLDIYLITQNSNLLAKDLLALSEYEIRAIPRTLAIGGFNYLRKSNKDIIGRVLLRKKKSVFNLYKSMQANETEKITTPYLKYLIPVVLLFIFGFYGLSQSFVGRAVTGDVSETENINKPALHAGAVVPVSRLNPVNNVIPFTQVSYTRTGSHVSVYNPITSELCPVAVFPYELKAVQSGKAIRLYARLPIDYKKEKTEN